MPIRTVIVDNEPAIVEGLKQMLAKLCPQIKVIDTAFGVSEARHILSITPVDLVFLDVKLGDGNSFTLLQQLDPVDFQVIFITAFDRYAVNAFKHSALDYLVKPIDEDDLIRSIKKAEKAIYSENLQFRLQKLLRDQQIDYNEKTIVLKTLETHHVVHIKDIMVCEAKGNYTVFHISNLPDVLISQTLKTYEDLLSEYNFFRCHQSYLVNMNLVIRYDKKDGGFLVLRNGDSIPVSNRKKEQLFKILDR